MSFGFFSSPHHCFPSNLSTSSHYLPLLPAQKLSSRTQLLSSTCSSVDLRYYFRSQGCWKASLLSSIHSQRFTIPPSFFFFLQVKPARLAVQDTITTALLSSIPYLCQGSCPVSALFHTVSFARRETRRSACYPLNNFFLPVSGPSVSDVSLLRHFGNNLSFRTPKLVTLGLVCCAPLYSLHLCG